MEVHSGCREGKTSPVPKTVISLAGSPRQEGLQGSLGYAAGKEQSPRGQEKEQSAKPQASERPGKERMEEHPGTDWIEGHRCHCSPLEEQLW